MRMTLLAVHITSGGLGIILGFIALYAAKGAMMHRRAGVLFVYAMLFMSIIGAAAAAVWGRAPETNVPAGLLTAYLVITGLTAVRAPAGWSRRLDVLLMLVAGTVALIDLTVGFQALTSADRRMHVMAIPCAVFATIAVLGSIGDARILWFGPHPSSARLARHLWRMSFALLIATFSFFIGQARVIPQPVRIFPLLMIPPLLVLGTLLYWLWRVRLRRNLRGVAFGALQVDRTERISPAKVSVPIAHGVTVP